MLKIKAPVNVFERVDRCLFLYGKMKFAADAAQKRSGAGSRAAQAAEWQAAEWQAAEWQAAERRMRQSGRRQS